MASTSEKFKKIRIAPAIAFNKESFWFPYMANHGWVWSDVENDWIITVGGVAHKGQDGPESDWYNLMDQYIAEHSNSINTVSKPGPINVPLYDAGQNSFYYTNILGQPVYDYSPTTNPLVDAMVGNALMETPNYNFDEIIVDILGNPIVPKKPQAGQYTTKAYFDLLTKTRKQYKEFKTAATESAKIKILEARANDIVSEEGRMLNLLGLADKAKATNNTVVSVVSIAGTIFGGGLGKKASTVVNKAVQYAQSQTTDKRIQLIGEDLKYIDSEYDAIKTYFDQRNVKLSSVTAASSIGNWFAKNWGWVVAAIVSVGTMIYVYRRKKLAENI